MDKKECSIYVSGLLKRSGRGLAVCIMFKHKACCLMELLGRKWCCVIIYLIALRSNNLIKSFIREVLLIEV